VLDRAVPVPPPDQPARGFAARCSRVLISPWFRFALLVVVLAGAMAIALVLEPERLPAHRRLPRP
jgi:hypothetical protein